MGRRAAFSLCMHSLLVVLTAARAACLLRPARLRHPGRGQRWDGGGWVGGWVEEIDPAPILGIEASSSPLAGPHVLPALDTVMSVPPDVWTAIKDVQC